MENGKGQILAAVPPKDDLKISDFCDMDRFEQMMQDWARSTGLAALAIGNDGKYISECYNFTDFCQKLTRKSPEGLRRCMECDRGGSGTYLCHAGLVDFSAPITLEDGAILGKVVGGQVLPERPDEARFRATARELGIDEDACLAELGRVNIRSREAIKASADLLSNVINLFVRTSYAARRNAESLSERTKIISSLSRIYFCDYYIDLESDRFLELDATEELHTFAGREETASGLLAASCRLFAGPNFLDEFLAFAEFSTLRKRLGQHQILTFEFVCRDSGWCRASFIPVSRDGGGNVSNVVYALQHIQEEKERELRIRQSLEQAAHEANRANHAKSEFLSQMSHDMRTPLNGILGFTDLALRTEDLLKKQNYLMKINASGRLMLELVNDVLNMSKLIG